MIERRKWLRTLRKENERQEDLLSPVFDERWGEVDDLHRTYVAAFLSRLPESGVVLDAPCGTGKYFQMVLDAGLTLLGVDHSSGHLTRARQKFPHVSTEKHDLQELPYRQEFDGVMCIDAMEFVPPEDWPVVMARFRQATRSDGWLYLTIELAPDKELTLATEKARRSGLPVVSGEALWDDPDGAYYHYYPSIPRVRAWLADAGFKIEEEVEGPREDEGYAYHHVLARLASVPHP
jgi:cyclopropane fatty-acyl-phospholipid synthase-like methyltransferase